jgi:hypothetical protein
MSKGKVSFDFDFSLSRPDVQKFAASLVEEGYEVWCVTSRTERPISPNGCWAVMEPQIAHQDLFKVANEVGISKEHIVFTNKKYKITFLEGKDYIFHLDDDDFELINIMKSDDPIVGRHVEFDGWEEDLRELLDEKK